MSYATCPGARKRRPEDRSEEPLQSLKVSSSPRAPGKSVSVMNDSTKRQEAARCSLNPVKAAYKIYESALETSGCRRPGDGSFFDANRTWYRLLKDFPISKEDKTRHLPCALEWNAAKVLDDEASIRWEATVDQLWDLFEVRSCNKTQLHALHDKFFGRSGTSSRDMLLLLESS